MDPVLFQNLLYATLTALIGLIAYALRGMVTIGIEYMKTKLGNEQFDALSKFAQTVVRFLEQSGAFENLDGAKKKELAIVAILKYAEENKIPVDREFVDKVIEAAVRIVKKEIGVVDVGVDYYTGLLVER